MLSSLFDSTLPSHFDCLPFNIIRHRLVFAALLATICDLGLLGLGYLFLLVLDMVIKQGRYAVLSV